VSTCIVCGQSPTIEAHLMPKALARYVGRDQPRNISISKDRIKTGSLGEYDPDILCRTCDQILGKLDEVAFNLCRNFARDHVRKPGRLFVNPRIDGQAISKFILSVLWRCSVSNRRRIANFNIKEHEKAIEDILFHGKPLEEFTGLQIYLMAWKARRNDPSKVFTYPERLNLPGKDIVSFLIPRFRVNVIFNGGVENPDVLKQLAVNYSKVARGFFIPFEDSAELNAMRETVESLTRQGKNSISRRATAPAPKLLPSS